MEKYIPSKNKENIYGFIETKYNDFSNKEKIFIHYILSNKNKAPFLSARQIANIIKVDPSTVVRFVKKIGFKGYLEFKESLRKAFIEGLSDSGDLYKAKEFNISDEKNIIDFSLNKSYSNLLELMKSINEKEIEKFSKIISDARKKIIIASRSSYSSGHFLSFILKKIIPEVFLIECNDYSYYDIFKDLNKEDVIIAISTPRYTKLTIDFVEYALRKKIKVISFTDSALSPLYSLSTSCLFVPYQSATFHNSYVAIMAILDAVIAKVFIQKNECAIKRLEREEEIVKDQKITFL